MNIYESEKLLAEYLLFHYGTAEETLPYSFGPHSALHYAVRCVSECLDVSRLRKNSRALDLGCALGGSSFELARHCPEVLGIDFSNSFISAAIELQQHGELSYERLDEGDLSTRLTARVAAGIDRSRVSFEVGDAMDLRDHLGAFDIVLMANLIDRLHAPRRCLERLSGLVNPGGQLIITSPYTWLEDFTPREHWLGGFQRDGSSTSTLEGLRAVLAKDFQLENTHDLPFLIREHARKFQWSVAQASIWIRR
jgi:putative 4-mercaptohistidine N1-methyltranferase